MINWISYDDDHYTTGILRALLFQKIQTINLPLISLISFV